MKDMMLNKVLCWIGAILLSICGLPQLIKVVQDGHAEGVAWGFVLSWCIGEICLLIGTYKKVDLSITLNYILNFIITSVIIVYKIGDI